MKGINKFLFLLVFLLAITPGLAFSFSANIEAVGGNGSVSVKREGKVVLLKQGDALKIGDEITTDKSTAVDIRFEDKTVLRLGVNSSYKISEEPKSKKFFHRLLSGIVRVLVPVKKDAHGKGEVRFHMATPEATIGVRGTEFVVVRDGSETKLKGLTGEVMFGPVDSDFKNEDQFVGVASGFESSVKKGEKAASKPRKYSMKDYLKELDNPNDNPFGSLYSRKVSAVKERSVEVAAASNDASKAKSKATPTKKAARVAGKVGQKRASKSAAKAVKKSGFMAQAETNAKNSKVVAKLNPELALGAAIASNDDSLARKALGKANPNYKDENGDAIIFHAAKHGRPNIVKMLIESGADVNAENKDGETPLLSLASQPVPDRSEEAKKLYIEAFKTLLMAEDIQVDAKDSKGDTALMQLAVGNASVDLAKELIDAGANINEPDMDGLTAIELAEENPNGAELAAYLKEESARLSEEK